MDKRKRSKEAINADKELVFQSDEKEKLASELIVANKELVLQNEENEKRAAELIIAHKELAFQNQEKENLALELFKSGEQLKALNAELELFSYSVSHDMRAPLRFIHAYTQMLNSHLSAVLDSEGSRLMNNIMTNAKKMGQLIDDMLTLSRLGRKELTKHTINMHDLVSEICQELENEQKARTIEFNIKQLLPAMADKAAIRQVWLNLISNAIKYSRLKDKTLIEIGCELKGDEIIYYVKDNGAGFDMNYSDKLFAVFQRLHSDKEFEGTGVGLAVVQRIVVKHGGRVWAEGKINEGAIFYFTLQKS